MMTMMNEDEHSLFAASDSDGWIPCPARVWMCKKADEKYGPEPPSSAAIEGTRVHMVASYLMKSHPMEEWGPAILALDESDEVKNALSMYLDTVAHYKRQLSGIMHVELRCVSCIDADFGGTPDVVVQSIDFNTVVIIDFKYGSGKEVSPASYQLQSYALLHLQDYFNSVEISPNNCPEKIILVVVQPRHHSHPKVKRIIKEPANGWYEMYLRKVKNAIMDARARPDDCVPGPHCEWCRGAFICGRGKKVAVELMDHSECETLSDVEFILQHENFIKSIIYKARGAAKELIKGGAKIDGYEVRSVLGRRKWAPNTELVEETLERLFGEDMWDKKLISPTQALKRIGAGKGCEVSQLIVREMGEEKLVGINDQKEVLAAAKTPLTPSEEKVVEELACQKN